METNRCAGCWHYMPIAVVRVDVDGYTIHLCATCAETPEEREERLDALIARLSAEFGIN